MCNVGSDKRIRCQICMISCVCKYDYIAEKRIGTCHSVNVVVDFAREKIALTRMKRWKETDVFLCCCLFFVVIVSVSYFSLSKQ